MTASDDEKYLKLALKLASNGRGKTSPNPMVGAVIVRNGKIVGQGYHKRAGTPHAEINALRIAREKARGAALYVNLEPCCHYGRTNPCTEEIIKAGIKEVIYSLRDPNPLVNGKGAAQLKSAGIKVRSGVLQKEAAKLNEIYLKYIKTGKPFVILKTAQSLDGRIATSKGDSRWITGLKSRKLAHRLRAECDAVVVGAGTVRNDDPELTARLIKGKNPYRIIVSGSANFTGSISLLRKNDDAKTILATTAKNAGKFRGNNLIIWSIREINRMLSLPDLLTKAGQFGITSLLVEGGAKLVTSFLREGLADKHYLFIAPMIIGQGIDAVGNLHINKIVDAMGYKSFEYNLQYTPDLLFVGYPKGK